MTERKRQARVAGLIYLALIVSGIFNLIYVPGELFDWENASQTVENIKESELLFRFGILSGIIMLLTFTILPFALDRLFKGINEIASHLMILFVLLSIPLSFMNILNKFSILTLLGDASFFNSYKSY